jgi:hypothetical protein
MKALVDLPFDSWSPFATRHLDFFGLAVSTVVGGEYLGVDVFYNQAMSHSIVVM